MKGLVYFLLLFSLVACSGPGSIESQSGLNKIEPAIRTRFSPRVRLSLPIVMNNGGVPIRNVSIFLDEVDHLAVPTLVFPTLTPPPTSMIAPPLASLKLFGLDFGDPHQKFFVKIVPDRKKVNAGKPILISFFTGESCGAGDHRACANAFVYQQKQPAVLLTVHSGVGGEAERFRHAVEGTGIDQAGFNLSRTQANLNALRSVNVTIRQGNTNVEGFLLVGIIRVPAKKIAQYFDAPIDQALEVALSVDESLQGSIIPGQPVILFETCGWKMPGEPWVKGMTSTTGSVYLGIIQKRP